MIVKKRMITVLLAVLMVFAMMPQRSVHAVEADLTPPVIDPAVSVDKKTATAGEKVTLAATVTDNVAVSGVFFYCYNDEKERSIVGWATYNETSGKWELEVAITDNTASGEWRISYISANDTNDNSTYLYDQRNADTAGVDLSAGDFTITGTSADLEPPVIDQAVSVDRKTATAGEKVTLSATVTDNVAVSGVFFYCYNDEKERSIVGWATYNETSGKWELEVAITDNTASGEWRISYISANDTNDNSTYLYDQRNADTSGKDLSAADFTVTDNRRIIYHPGNGSTVAPQYVVPGQKATRPADPEKEGAIFGGWYSDEGLTKPFDFSEPVNEDVELYAEWNAPITTVDIGNIWTRLDPVNVVPFTAEVHDELDTDGKNFNDKMAIDQEMWTSEGLPAITTAEPGIPVVGNTYFYSVSLKAQKGWAFNKNDTGLPFGLIVGGTVVDPAEHMVTALVAADQKSVTLFFRSAPVAPVTVEPVDLSGAAVTGIVDKTYTGKAQTQDPVVKMEVNGTPFTLGQGKDYDLMYSNNTSAGKATVNISGKGNYSGKATATFTIRKAANALSVKGKRVKLKYKKLKKKAQTLQVASVISFTKKGQGAMSYQITGVDKAKYRKYFSINSKTGAVTVKKKLKKGTYKVTMIVRAAGNSNYSASTQKTVTCTVAVK